MSYNIAEKVYMVPWEEQQIHPNLISKEVFEVLLVYQNTNNFKRKSENAKKLRAMKQGAALIQQKVLVSTNTTDG